MEVNSIMCLGSDTKATEIVYPERVAKLSEEGETLTKEKLCYWVSPTEYQWNNKYEVDETTGYSLTFKKDVTLLFTGGNNNAFRQTVIILDESWVR